MTRYIGEPSPEKKIAEGRALTESLARRPGPESASIWAWIRSENRVIAGVGATYYNPFYIPTGTLTSESKDETKMKAITTASTSNNIRAYLPGIYLAEFDCLFVEAFTATVVYRLSVDGGTHGPPIRISNTSVPYANSNSSHGMNRLVIIKAATVEDPVRFSADVLQQSGSDKTISDARLMVTRLSSL